MEHQGQPPVEATNTTPQGVVRANETGGPSDGGGSKTVVAILAAVAAVAIAAAILMGLLWQQSASDLGALEDQVEADEQARVEAEEARPDLEALAEDTFGDEGIWQGDEDAVTVVVRDGLGLSLIEYLDDLGFSSAVEQRMGRTRALDGTQDAEGDGVNATWTYHPDNGLQVVFEVAD